MLGDLKYLMRSVKHEAEAVGIWTEDNWNVKRVNLLYTIISGRFNFKRNIRFNSLNWSLVVRDFYTRRGYIIGEINEKKSRLGKRKRRRDRPPFSFRGYSILFCY